MFGTHKAFHAFRETHFLSVYKRIRLGHPRFDKVATPERRKCAGTFFFPNVVHQNSMEQIISIKEIFSLWKAFNVSESFPEFSVHCVCVFLKRIRVGPEGLQDDKRALEDEKNEKKSRHQADLI